MLLHSNSLLLPVTAVVKVPVTVVGAVKSLVAEHASLSKSLKIKTHSGFFILTLLNLPLKPWSTGRSGLTKAALEPMSLAVVP
jgi:hypothetical protein